MVEGKVGLGEKMSPQYDKKGSLGQLESLSLHFTGQVYNRPGYEPINPFSAVLLKEY